VQLSGPLHLVWRLDLDLVERSACGLQMPLRQMQVDGGGPEIGMPEQSLPCGQIGAVFDQPW